MKDQLLEIAKIARDRAYAPYSKFHVGCAIKSTNNQIYSGCNIENASYSLTMCAEATAIASMLNAGAAKIAELTVISSGNEICTPCGACRQRIREFSTPTTVINMYSADGKHLTSKFDDLLPHSFGPQHLEC
jgi:cytidine deaminase